MTEKSCKSIRVKNLENKEIKTFRISKDWKELEDVFECFWVEMWDAFLCDMDDEIQELYHEWKEMAKNNIKSDMGKRGKSHVISGFEITETKED